MYDVKNVANLEKTVPIECVINDETYLLDKFIRYAKPLIQAELTPIMVIWRPKTLVFRRKK